MSYSVVISASQPKIGTWTLAPRTPPAGAVAEWDALARHVVASFVAAFDGFMPVEQAEADVMRLAADGKVTGYAEGAAVAVAAGGNLELPPGASPPGIGQLLITAAYLDCSVLADQGGAEFYYGCVVDFDDEDHARPEDAQAILSVTADVWSPETVGEARAERNRQRLEAALASWESRSGAPITEWQSDKYPKAVSRYGFNLPAPADK
jgi:hypothetical protein